jgi:hypothetical protein
MTAFARRAHRLATRAYPQAFRRRFAGDLDRVFADRMTRATAISRPRAAFLLLFLLADTVVSGLAERAHPTSRRSPTMVLESLSADLRFTRHRHRREHGYLQRRQRGTAPAAALCRARQARRHLERQHAPGPARKPRVAREL